MGFDSAAILETASNLSTSDHTSVVAITLFVTLLCACIVIGHLLEENRWMNESITALVIVSIFMLLSLHMLHAFADHHVLFGASLWVFYCLILPMKGCWHRSRNSTN